MEVKALGDAQQSLMRLIMDEPMLDPDILKDSIESLSREEFADIIDGFADHIGELDAAGAMADKKSTEFRNKRDEFARYARNERGIVEKLLRLRGERKIKTAYYSVGIQKNGGKEPLLFDADISDIPAEYLIPQNPKPDNDKIRDLLKTQTVSWAHLGERGESLRIK